MSQELELSDTRTKFTNEESSGYMEGCRRTVIIKVRDALLD